MGCTRDCVSASHSPVELMLMFSIRNNLSSVLDNRSQLSLKRHIFSSDVAVQTDSVVISAAPQSPDAFDRSKRASSEDDEISSLTAADLGSILKWSKEISIDINLSLALQRLTEIATGMQNILAVFVTS